MGVEGLEETLDRIDTWFTGRFEEAYTSNFAKSVRERIARQLKSTVTDIRKDPDLSFILSAFDRENMIERHRHALSEHYRCAKEMNALMPELEDAKLPGETLTILKNYCRDVTGFVDAVQEQGTHVEDEAIGKAFDTYLHGAKGYSEMADAITTLTEQAIEQKARAFMSADDAPAKAKFFKLSGFPNELFPSMQITRLLPRMEIYSKMLRQYMPDVYQKVLGSTVSTAS